MSLPAADTATTPASRQDLLAYLEHLDIRTDTVEHEAVFTVAESDRLERQVPGGHTKNLFLKDAKNRLFLVVAQAHTAIDLKLLHKTLGCARLSFGRPDLLMETLGVPPGSVTAFAVLNDRPPQVSVILDAALMAYEVINCHPLVNSATASIRRDDLLKFLRATGHEPRILPLSN